MDDFRAFIITVSEHLSAADVEKITYLTKLPSDSREPRRALDVLQTLEERNVFSASSRQGLCDLMHTIGRSDVAHLVEQYRPAPPPPLLSLPLTRRNLGRSASELRPERCEVVGSSSVAADNYRERVFSLPTPSLSTASPTAGCCKEWVLMRKHLNEDIYEHKCSPFKQRKPMIVGSAEACPLLPAPRLHLTLYPSGLEMDRGTYVTLEARASAHDFPSGEVIGERMEMSTLNVQKVRVFRFISHQALKMSHSKQIEIKVWAWASLLGDDEYTVEPVEGGYAMVSLLHSQ
ncbi:hypothetical protein EMCRGX_G012841 [Ephydatia muelleri]